MFQRNLFRTFSITPVGCHRHLSQSRPKSAIVLGHHVREALANGCPVVALESTVITHGLPEPQNLELALQLEREIADGLWWAADNTTTNSMRGAVTPATVGIIRGQLVVGLSRDQLEFLANSKVSQPIKASRRDIPLAQALALSAGTTVSATMAIATSCAPNRTSQNSNGISVFATGGLGGVHLGGELSMDISADLYEMMQTPIGLVSSGFKSFLDTRRSLELLESLGCTVVSLKPSERAHSASSSSTSTHQDEFVEDLNVKLRTCQPFPGFFTAINKERVKSPWQCESVQEAARILYHCLGAQSSEFNSIKTTTATTRAEIWPPVHLSDARAMLLACPIPAEFSLDQEATERNENNYSSELLNEICAQIDKRHDLAGNDKTPLILAELNRLTRGQTLGANLELLKNNARIGAHLAHELAKLCQQVDGVATSFSGLIGPNNNNTSELGQRQTCQTKDGGQKGGAMASSIDKRPRGKSPIVVGCTMIDMHVRTKMDAQFKANQAHSGVTFDGEPKMVVGGVGQNLAAALELLGHKPTFVTSLAGDNLGDFARGEMFKLFGANDHLDCSSDNQLAQTKRLEILKWSEPEASSCFALVLIDSISGQCQFVIANIEARRALSRSKLEVLFDSGRQLASRLQLAPLLVLDANLLKETIEFMLELGHKWLVPVFIEPTDVGCLPDLVQVMVKLQMAGNKGFRSALVCLSPNAIELETMLRLFSGDNSMQATSTDKTVDTIQEMARELMEHHLPELRCLLVTLDSRGVLVGLRKNVCATNEIDQTRLDRDWQSSLNKSLPAPPSELVFKHYLPNEVIKNPVSASGAGDCFAAGFISGLIDERPLKDCVEFGFKASSCALMDKNTVPKSLANLIKRT